MSELTKNWLSNATKDVHKLGISGPPLDYLQLTENLQKGWDSVLFAQQIKS